MPLTKRQFQVLFLLDRFVQEKGYCPELSTKSEKAFTCPRWQQYTSTSTPWSEKASSGGTTIAAARLKSSTASHSTRQPKQSEPQTRRRLGLRKICNYPLLGRIAAGRPLEAVPSNESLSLKEFVGSKSVFVLQVKGSSMVEDHICDGDFVVVEKTQSAENGDTVVALIDNGEATLKKFYREKNDYVRLQPANAEMQPIVVKAKDLTIQGRVIAVLRKY